MPRYAAEPTGSEVDNRWLPPAPALASTATWANVKSAHSESTSVMCLEDGGGALTPTPDAVPNGAVNEPPAALRPLVGA